MFTYLGLNLVCPDAKVIVKEIPKFDEIGGGLAVINDPHLVDIVTSGEKVMNKSVFAIKCSWFAINSMCSQSIRCVCDQGDKDQSASMEHGTGR